MKLGTYIAQGVLVRKWGPMPASRMVLADPPRPNLAKYAVGPYLYLGPLYSRTAVL